MGHRHSKRSPPGQATKKKQQQPSTSVRHFLTEPEPEPESKLRVVLLGKTGAGKSSLGNTLLGRDDFLVVPGLSSGTVERQVGSAKRFGTVIQVTDTPGLCDTHRQEAEVLEEVRNSVTAVHPGPHIVLLVLRCDTRFTEEEYKAVGTLKTLFGSLICRHMIIVFNGIDHLDDSLALQRTALDEQVEEATGNLRHALDDVSFRYYGVNNKAVRSIRDLSAMNIIDMMETLAAENEWAYLTCESDTSSNEDEGDDEVDG